MLICKEIMLPLKCARSRLGVNRLFVCGGCSCGDFSVFYEPPQQISMALKGHWCLGGPPGAWCLPNRVFPSSLPGWCKTRARLIWALSQALCMALNPIICLHFLQT